MVEEWKTIDINPNYEVSNFGRVRNKKGHIMKLQVGTHGYFQVNLDFDGKNKTKKVHRLVATAFIPNPYNKPQINHIDGNKQNNHISNLEWCTGSENVKHAFNIGLNENMRKVSSITIKNAQKIAHEQRKRAVIQTDLNGNFVKEFSSAREAKDYYGIKDLDKYISMCCNGKLKTTHSYKWKFK